MISCLALMAVRICDKSVFTGKVVNKQNIEVKKRIPQVQLNNVRPASI